MKVRSVRRLTLICPFLLCCAVCVLYIYQINQQLNHARKVPQTIVAGNKTNKTQNEVTSSPSTPTTTTTPTPTTTTTAKCSPKDQVLFLKTHKTGSSTLANIFFRYGDSRDLTFVLGGDTNVGWPQRFQVSHIFRLDNQQPNILCSHTRFNKKPMNWLFPKESSKYITILRNPVDQFESVFNFMGFGPIFRTGNNTLEALKVFLSKGILFPGVHKTIMTHLARNPMSFDLGLNYKFYQNLTAINEYIQFLENEFDLVMIMEYFDESLVLLKRLLCWEIDDIVYFKLNERQDKEKAKALSEDVKENIKRWNKADTLLFDHFNQTFWQKVKLEGPGFYEDLAAFRQKKDEVRRLCLTDKTSIQFAYGKKYVKGYTLREGLSADLKLQCERLTRSENSYLALLRKKREVQLKNLFEQTASEKKEDQVGWDVAKELVYKPV